jgi:hypothetical protein
MLFRVLFAALVLTFAVAGFSVNNDPWPNCFPCPEVR